MNLRTLTRADLQSAAIDRSAIPPHNFLSNLLLRKLAPDEALARAKTGFILENFPDRDAF